MASSRLPYSTLLQDIRYEILAHLNAADLKSMTEAGCGIASKELLLRFTSILVHFALDPTAFRMCMKDSGAVISGSTALAVILPRRRSFVPNDIDIYVGSTGLPVVLHYLMAKTPYTKESLLSKTRGGDIDYNGLVGGTAMLSVRLLQDPESGKTLNLIEASTVSPLPVIWGFHSTLVMNVVLYSGVGSAYPAHAFEEIGVVNCVRGRAIKRSGLVRALDKYRQRGFRLFANLIEVFTSQDNALISNPALSWHQCGTWAYCPQTTRDSLDPGMLWVPFPEHTLERMVEDIPSVSWKLAHDGNCARSQIPCLGWLEDIDGHRSCIITGF